MVMNNMRSSTSRRSKRVSRTAAITLEDIPEDHDPIIEAGEEGELGQDEAEPQSKKAAASKKPVAG